MHILHVVGARPNFMKLGPVHSALAGREGIRQTVVHTGQHYDPTMSDLFFQQLQIPPPDINLEVGSGSQGWQTAQIMIRIEEVLADQKPDLVLVYGDVNSTLAAALVSSKLLIPFGHVEAGLRSFDRTMPEEVNRIVIDSLADLLFTPSHDADLNLRRAGVEPGKIHQVGNIMIDSLVRLLPFAERCTILEQLGLRGNRGTPEKAVTYGLVTLHRPATVDDREVLRAILATLADLGREVSIIFPVHPRTRQRLQEIDLEGLPPGLRLTEPLGAIEFLALQRHAAFVVTDSGGVQEETTFLGVPCLTVRENTERPITVMMGTNILVGYDMQRLRAEVAKILSGHVKRGQVPPMWDGCTGQRIADHIVQLAST
jgi:UDP-N-acetylglucosamine 2-epimerase (non-hydrolysing)